MLCSVFAILLDFLLISSLFWLLVVGVVTARLLLHPPPKSSSCLATTFIVAGLWSQSHTHTHTHTHTQHTHSQITLLSEIDCSCSGSHVCGASGCGCHGKLHLPTRFWLPSLVSRSLNTHFAHSYVSCHMYVYTNVCVPKSLQLIAIQFSPSVVWWLQRWYWYC